MGSTVSVLICVCIHACVSTPEAASLNVCVVTGVNVVVCAPHVCIWPICKYVCVHLNVCVCFVYLLFWKWPSTKADACSVPSEPNRNKSGVLMRDLALGPRAEVAAMKHHPMGALGCQCASVGSSHHPLGEGGGVPLSLGTPSPIDPLSPQHKVAALAVLTNRAPKKFAQTRASLFHHFVVFPEVT